MGKDETVANENKDPIFANMFPTLLETFQNSYPELERAKDLILSTFLNEETKYL